MFSCDYRVLFLFVHPSLATLLLATFVSLVSAAKCGLSRISSSICLLHISAVCLVYPRLSVLAAEFGFTAARIESCMSTSVLHQVVYSRMQYSLFRSDPLGRLAHCLSSLLTEHSRFFGFRRDWFIICSARSNMTTDMASLNVT